MELATAQRSAPQDLESLVRSHQVMVWRYLRLLGAEATEAEDLMQETFLRAAGQVGGGARLRAPGAFLRCVARNLLVSQRRAACRQAPTVEWSDAVEGAVEQQPDLLADQRIEALRHCLSRLRGRARQAVELHYLQRLDYRTVAARMGLQRNGLKALLQRARRCLRDCTTAYLRGNES